MIAEVFIFVEQKLESPYEYMKYKILNAPINYYPYPHISIENIFPQEFYDSLLENLPNIDEYTPKPKYPGKHTLTLENFDLLDDDKKYFWTQINSWLKSDDFSNLLLNKFSITKLGYSDFYLHKDLNDFEVKPHRDLFSKLVTYLFYLPKDSSLDQLGTEILVPKPDVSIPDTTAHQNWEQFNIVRSAKYVPNSFFSFIPCANSYHAVKIKFPDDIKKKERDTIRGFVFDKSVDDHPSYLFNK
jgi:hypothetical protein